MRAPSPGRPARVRRGPRPAARRAGFTLIEVMLTLLIMGGIMVSITQILHAARISRDTIHNINETQLAGPAIVDMIERDLRAILIANRDRKQHLRVVNRIVRGLDADSIDFVTTTDSLVVRREHERYLRSDVNEVGYRLRPSPFYDDFLEIYRREDMGVDDEPFEGGEYSFLHDRVKGLDIRIFDEDGPDAEPIEEWGDGRVAEHIGLPARIEITLTLELSPRIGREQLRIQSVERRTQVYKRIVRFPESLRVADADVVVPRVPVAPGGTGPATGVTGGEGAEGAGEGAPSAGTAPATGSGRPQRTGRVDNPFADG